HDALPSSATPIKYQSLLPGILGSIRSKACCNNRGCSYKAASSSTGSTGICLNIGWSATLRCQMVNNATAPTKTMILSHQEMRKRQKNIHNKASVCHKNSTKNKIGKKE